ncbi:MAG: lipopolysaccharide heptosyltransferase I [Gammaproteobacteria bacterium]|nr:lipopolysaccharide heptosyltransferase I [Gammaproteobacteria bacterium]|tara:strand:+ start:419 stop:1399 length:981 start_codon:yes stop_codon:yes gene_type:complete
MKVLIIKLTSMGDLMHALPALTDASNVYPDIQFDWIVDENFSDVPSWHPKVSEIITTNHRTWRKQLLSGSLRRELKELKTKINVGDYDVVIDMQNNLKSAVLSYFIKKEVHGLDKNSAREYPAHWAYAFKHEVPKNLHAVARQRSLLAQSLNYKIGDKSINYKVDKSIFRAPDFSLPNKYLVLVHNASWPTKLWPISHWQRFIKLINQEGYTAILPSGSEEEISRAEEIVSSNNKAIALKKLTLNEVAYVIEHSLGCVCSDTGLAHLSAVLDKPSVTMYSVTDESLIGTRGKNQEHLISYDNRMESITPEEVLKRLNSVKQKSGGG